MHRNIFHIILLISTLCSSFHPTSAQSSETRKITDPFTGIAVAGPFSITVTIGTENTLVIQGQPNVIKNIETVVEDGSLKIRSIDWNVPFTGILQIQVTAKNLINLVAAGSSLINVQTPLQGKSIRVVVAGSASLQGTFAGDSLSAVVSESGSFIATANVKNMNAVISDSGAITVSGTAENANVVVSGSGVFHGQGLVASSVSTTVSGSGRAEVQSVQELKVQVIELGVVRYKGNPKVTSEKHDEGTVEKF